MKSENKFERISPGQAMDIYGDDYSNMGNEMIEEICTVTSMLKKIMALDILNNVFFVSDTKCDGFYLNLEKVDERHVIFLSKTLLDLGKTERRLVILHELGHYIRQAKPEEASAETFVEEFWDESLP